MSLLLFPPPPVLRYLLPLPLILPLPLLLLLLCFVSVVVQVSEGGGCVGGREEGLQREVRDLEQRCQGAEARHQDLAANIPEATRPLLRQLEAMQVPHPTPPRPMH